MEIPKFGQPQNPDPYQIPDVNQSGSKKTLFIMAGGVLLLTIIIAWLFLGTGGKPGAEDMKVTVQNTSEALGIIDEYEGDLQYTPTKNDIALVQILLRGNYSNLNELYNKTYKPKKKFSNSPKPDKVSQTKLDAAKRNNVLDSEIITVLEPKIAAAKAAAKRSYPNFSKPDSLNQLKTAYNDYGAIEDILNRDR
jgi:hypothetical protein